jgi:hypothetical protein
MKNRTYLKRVAAAAFVLLALASTTGAALPKSNQSSLTATVSEKTASILTGSKLAGQTLSTDSLYPFKVTGTITGSSSRSIFLQKYIVASKTWSNVSSTVAYPGKTFNLSLPQTKATETYRTYAPETVTHTAHTGVSTVVKRTSPAAEFYSQMIAKTRVTPWANNSASVFVQSRLLAGEAPPNVTLQEMRNGHWVNLKTVTTQGRISWPLPKGTTSSPHQTRSYRYVINASKFSNQGISKTFKVNWENPRKYTGVRLTAYNYASRYCPNMMVDIKKLPKGIAGQAYMGRDVTALSPDIKSWDLKTVSLHECAHHRQWSLYPGGPAWDGFTSKMNALYKSSGSMGFEYNADCIADVWGKNSYWGYGRICTGQQVMAAKALASGKRY